MAIENKVLNTRIKLKRDTSANWTTNNPVLLNGEIIIVDTAEGEVRFKIGDGSKTYTQLPFEDEDVRNLIADKSKITVEAWTDSSGSTTQFLNELVINKVKDRQTYEEMVDAGKVDINELYFIEEDDEIAITTYATTGTKIATITIGNETTDIYAPSIELPETDTTLTQSGAIADAKATGDKINEVKTAVDSKMDKENPTGVGVLSMNRRPDTEIGEYSTALGSFGIASGMGSFVEGHGSIASGEGAHAGGESTEASGLFSKTGGSMTKASGSWSKADGTGSIASGDRSSAEGYNTIAARDNQHVQGKFNIEDTSEYGLAHIVGNGNSVCRSNAHTLDWEGNAWFAGNVYVGSSTGMDKDEGSTRLINEIEFDDKFTTSKADWNQNIEIASNYIKNRTHWIERNYETIISETIESEYTRHIELPNNELLQGSYSVIIDGIEYQCDGYYYEGYYNLGDSRLISDASHPMDVPFLIMSYYGAPGSSVGGSDNDIAQMDIFYLDSNSHTIEIKKATGEAIYHALNENFIPDTIARKTDLDSLNLITVEDIDTICGGSIQYAEDVTF